MLKPVRYIDPEEVIETGEILLFVNPAFVISVRHGRPARCRRCEPRLDSDPDLISHGPGAVLYAILDRVVDDYEPVVEGVDADIQQIEEQVFSDDRHAEPGRSASTGSRARCSTSTAPSRRWPPPWTGSRAGTLR